MLIAAFVTSREACPRSRLSICPQDQDQVRQNFTQRCEAFRHDDGLHIPAIQLLVAASR